jgi:hypothetical protein
VHGGRRGDVEVPGYPSGQQRHLRAGAKTLVEAPVIVVQHSRVVRVRRQACEEQHCTLGLTGYRVGKHDVHVQPQVDRDGVPPRASQAAHPGGGFVSQRTRSYRRPLLVLPQQGMDLLQLDGPF